MKIIATMYPASYSMTPLIVAFACWIAACIVTLRWLGNHQ